MKKSGISIFLLLSYMIILMHNFMHHHHTNKICHAIDCKIETSDNTTTQTYSSFFLLHTHNNCQDDTCPVHHCNGLTEVDYYLPSTNESYTKKLVPITNQMCLLPLSTSDLAFTYKDISLYYPYKTNMLSRWVKDKQSLRAPPAV